MPNVRTMASLRAARRCQPTLELLEDRRVPARSNLHRPNATLPGRRRQPIEHGRSQRPNQRGGSRRHSVGIERSRRIHRRHDQHRASRRSRATFDLADNAVVSNYGTLAVTGDAACRRFGRDRQSRVDQRAAPACRSPAASSATTTSSSASSTPRSPRSAATSSSAIPASSSTETPRPTPRASRSAADFSIGTDGILYNDGALVVRRDQELHPRPPQGNLYVGLNDTDTSSFTAASVTIGNSSAYRRHLRLVQPCRDGRHVTLGNDASVYNGLMNDLNNTGAASFSVGGSLALGNASAGLAQRRRLQRRRLGLLCRSRSHHLRQRQHHRQRHDRRVRVADHDRYGSDDDRRPAQFPRTNTTFVADGASTAARLRSRRGG